MKKTDSNNELPVLMTITEVALYLGVHENSVRNYIKDGKLKRCSVGRPRFFKEDVVQFLKDNSTTTNAEVRAEASKHSMAKR